MSMSGYEYNTIKNNSNSKFKFNASDLLQQSLKFMCWIAIENDLNVLYVQFNTSDLL